MNTQYRVGECYYFPLHGVGHVTAIERDVMRVDLHGVVAYIDFSCRPVYFGDNRPPFQAPQQLTH